MNKIIIILCTVLIFAYMLYLFFYINGIDISSNISALLEGRAEGFFANPIYISVMLVVVAVIITSIILLKLGA